MDQREQEWVASMLEREMLLRSPADYGASLSHDLWQPYSHLVYTSNAIVDMVEHDDCDLLVIDQPVRHGKTELCSRWTPAWFLSKFPDKRVLLASYEADFAATHGRRAREIIREHGARFGIELDDTSRAANRWELVTTRGGMATAGAGGPITGKGGHLLIVDDPIKNSEEARSQVMRDNLWDWFKSTFLTRREPGGKVLVIMSRWHEDDLLGRLLKADTGMRVKRLRMPAIAEDDDLLGRVPGQALCPERYDEEALAGIRKDVGPGPWASLYQQRPVPLGGGMFKRDWVLDFTTQVVGDETFYQLGDKLVSADDCYRFATMDTAYTKSKRSDYTAAAVWAVTPTDPACLLLLDMRRKRVEHADHAPLIESIWRDYSPSWVGLEKQMATLSLFDEVQRRGVVMRWLTPDKHKVARAETAAALFEQGRIFVPRDAIWLADYIEELVTFPVGKHDDQVDVTSYAANELSKQVVRGHRRKREPETLDDRMWAAVQKMHKPKQYHPVLGRMP